MPRRSYLAAIAAAALMLGAGPALAGCGGDDEETDDPAVETEQTESPPEPPAPYGEDETGAPLVPDEGHEGGGPDPGTGEGEGSNGGPYGGGGSRGGGSGGGGGNDGLSPPERFEQFCRENPEACT